MTTFATTVRLQADAIYAQRAYILPIPDMLPTSKYRLQDEWRIFSVVLGALFTEKQLLLNPCRGRFKPELFATILANIIPSRWRPRILWYGDMFQPSGGRREQVERFLVQLADRVTQRYVLLAEAEKRAFSETWRVDTDKIRVCPYFLAQNRYTHLQEMTRSQHIFAGGNSFRHYEPLLEAAKRMPEYQFVFCTPAFNGRSDLPPNVRAGLVSHQEYVEYINSAAAVVIPLQTGLKRMAGLQTCFDAMWLQKPVIISDALGIREYVTHKETGFIVDGSAQSYQQAITWVMGNENETAVQTMCEKARQVIVQEYTLSNHVQHLLGIIDEVTS